MKLIILKENLSKALSIVGRSISLRPQLPILSNVLLKAKDNVVMLHATNLDIGTLFTLPAKVEKEGEVAVPGKLLQEFVSSLSSEKIECTLDGTNLILQSGKTKASFTTVSAGDFPPFPTFTQQRKTLQVDTLKGLVGRTAFAASSDETRPVLTGIRMKLLKEAAAKKGSFLQLAATDGYRMSLEYDEVKDLPDDFHIILPAQSLIETVRIATEVKAESVGLIVIEGKNQVAFLLPQVTVFTRLIDGEFPTIEKIIPTMYKTKVTLDREQFTQSVKIAALFARGAANIIKIKVEKEGVRLTANAPQVGSDEDFVEARVEGEEVEVAFNYRFLLDLLNNFPEKEIVFESSGALNPGVFRSASAKSSFLHIIMPVRVQN